MSYSKIMNLERQLNVCNRKIYMIRTENNILINKLRISIKSENEHKQALINNNNNYLCNICYDNTKNIILNPCFHFNLCDKCLTKIDKCPVCRTPIECYHYVFGE